MSASYNQLAGHSVERLAALSDGIFAVAMTLLLLELRVPAKELIHAEGDLRAAFLRLLPQLLVYLMRFITLGIFWVGQQTQLNHLERSNRGLTSIHLAFLFCVTLMPFSTRLLTEFLAYRFALVAYWANILLLGATLYASWAARHAGTSSKTTFLPMFRQRSATVFCLPRHFTLSARCCPCSTLIRPSDSSC